MADKKISALTAAALPLDGTEVLPIVKSGATVKVANNDLRPKQIQSNATSGVLQIAGPAAAATRVMTTPDANFTVARTDATQTFTGTQNISNTSRVGMTVSYNNTVALYQETAWASRLIAGGYWDGANYVYGASNRGAVYIGFDHDNNSNPQGFSFYTAPQGTAGTTISFTSLASIDKNGNYVPSTANKGINFTANTPATGMTSQLLNWYEEGTYTPTVASSSGALTSYTATAAYTRIGRQVTVVANVTITNAGTGAGALTITLPWTANASYAFNGAGRENALTGYMLQAYISAGGTVVNTTRYDGVTAIATNAQIRVTVTYFA